MFYIFMVWNKRLEVHALVYDMERNVLYENKDVDVKIQDDEEMEAFLTDAAEKVQKKSAHPKKFRAKTKEQAIEPDEFESSLEMYAAYPYARNGAYDPYDLGGPAWIH